MALIPAPLLVVTDRHGHDRPLIDTVRAVLDGGARWVWFRDKDLEPEPRRALAAELLSVVRAAGGHLTVGGGTAIAAEIGAAGVHREGRAFAAADGHQTVVAGEAKQSGEPHRSTTQAGLLRFARNGGGVSDAAGASVAQVVEDARSRLGPGALVGLSAHGLSDVGAARSAGADYVTLSPIFVSPSKPGYGPALGPGVLRAASEVGIPVIALGGIGADEARRCRSAGAAGVAVMGALMRAADPAAETRRLLDALGR